TESDNIISNMTGPNISNRIGKLPSGLSNLTTDTTSSLVKPMTGCSITIEGGGQRPNPDVFVSERGPANIIPLKPLDDGQVINQDMEYHHKINVGELVKLRAKVNGIPLDNIESIKWEISEPKIKDYDESKPGKFVTYNTEQDY